MEQKKPRPEDHRQDHRRMTKAELSERLSALQSTPESESVGIAREKELQTVLHELEVYQIELEMQVRELRESRQALEESHDRYVNLYDFAPVGYITLSDQGLIQEINLTAASMLGVERQWLINRSLAPWVMGTDLPLFRAHMTQCRKEGGKAKSNLRLLRRDKTEIPVELSTACFADPTTGRVLARTAITDLTERRKAETELDRFFGLSSDLLCILGSDSRFKRINPACENILGYTSTELLGRPCIDFIHPDDRDRSLAEFRRQGQEGASLINFQNRYIRKDRSIIWLSWSTMTSGGQFFCVGRDITAQVQAKKETENQYHWLREMVRLMPLPLSLVEAGTGSLVSMSQAAEAAFRGAPQSMSETDVSASETYCSDESGTRLPPEAWPRARAAKGEELTNEPAIVATPHGIVHLLVSSRNIPNKYEHPAMAVVVSQDVTQLKRTEESLTETVEKLKLERALRESFVFALTHDLRTPLTTVKMSAQLLVRESEDPAIIPQLSDRIIKSVDRIDHMIQDLLDANRIRAGEALPMKLTEFDLTELVRSTMGDLTTIHGQRFKLHAQAQLVGTWSKHDLRRVIENLVGNAIKYGDKKRPITISVVKKPKHQAVLTVQNFGRVIPEEELKTLFRQFRRTTVAETGGQKGWGIGLTLVRGIVEAHGGEIDVESNERDGTTFRVVLPLKSRCAYPVKPGLTIGHEPVGVIEELGSAVLGYEVGQRVIAGAITPCGQCYPCLDGDLSQCGGTAAGGWKFGNTIDGCQAEFVLVPNATANLTVVPDGLSDEQVLMCPDIMSTGFGGAESGHIRIGDTVVVFAQGPIGLCATAGARLCGASRIIAVDHVDQRLEFAKSMGATDLINYEKSDPLKEIMRLTGGRGADVSIEALGTQQTFESCLRALRPGGTLSSLGVYSGKLTLPLDAFAAGLGDHKIVTTLCHGGKERMRRLMNVVSAKAVDFRAMVTHRFKLDQIQEAYDLFSHQRDGVLKVAIVP